jgi:hypothetical protein
MKNKDKSNQWLNAVDKDGNTALHLACMSADTALIKKLLPLINNFNFVNNQRKTAIMCYLQVQYDRDTLQLMLNYFNHFEQTAALLSVRDYNDETAIFYACRRKDVYAIELLLRHGAKLERNKKCYPLALLGNLSSSIITELDKHGALIGQDLPHNNIYSNVITLQGSVKDGQSRIESALSRIKLQYETLQNLRAQQILLQFPTLLSMDSDEAKCQFLQDILHNHQLSKHDFINIVKRNLLQCTDEFSDYKEILFGAALYLLQSHDWLAECELQSIKLVLDDLSLNLDIQVKKYIHDLEFLLRKKVKKDITKEIEHVIQQRDILLNRLSHSPEQSNNIKAIKEREGAFSILYENALQSNLLKVFKLMNKPQRNFSATNANYINEIVFSEHEFIVRNNKLNHSVQEVNSYLSHFIAHVRKGRRQFPKNVEIYTLFNAIEEMQINIKMDIIPSSSVSSSSLHEVTTDHHLNRNREDILTLLDHVNALVIQLAKYHRETTLEMITQVLKISAAIQFWVAVASCLVALSIYCVANFYLHDDARYVLVGPVLFAFTNLLTSFIEKAGQYILACLNQAKFMDQLPISTIKVKDHALRDLVNENLKSLDEILQQDFAQETETEQFHRLVDLILNRNQTIFDVKNAIEAIPEILTKLMQRANVQRKTVAWQFFKPHVQMTIQQDDINERTLLLEGVGSVNR